MRILLATLISVGGIVSSFAQGTGFESIFKHTNKYDGAITEVKHQEGVCLISYLSEDRSTVVALYTASSGQVTFKVLGLGADFTGVTKVKLNDYTTDATYTLNDELQINEDKQIEVTVYIKQSHVLDYNKFVMDSFSQYNGNKAVSFKGLKMTRHIASFDKDARDAYANCIEFILK